MTELKKLTKLKKLFDEGKIPKDLYDQEVGKELGISSGTVSV